MTAPFFVSIFVVLLVVTNGKAQDTPPKWPCQDDATLLRDKTTGKPVLLKGEELRKNLTLHQRPKFPPSCRCQGNVVAQVMINTQGEAQCVDVISGHPLFRAYVSEAVRAWRFTPTVIEGKSYSVAGLIIFNFESAGGVYDNVSQEKKYCEIQTDNLLKHPTHSDVLSGEETKKRAFHQVIPSCPPNIECDTTMTVDIFVNPQGKVECVGLPARGHVMVKTVVGEAMKQWKFRPLRVKGKAAYFNGQLSIPIKAQ